ncbi:hypothetical protein M514_01996 [Trichuris suis]|uniref:Uncharacterized protein n=1 Tax=Trichuris suis TaxID=68888 RepID=A0A085NJI4_9BILA|nr:hypothetical protein M514_01996 [Trichuris suis]
MNDDNSTDSQTMGDLLSPSFDINAAYRPRNLERTVEAFRRENSSLRVEVYYLKTRLHEAGITFRSPDPEQYKLDAVIFKQKLEEKEKQLSLMRQAMPHPQARIALAEDIRQLRNQLERARSKNDALRVKCEQLEQTNKEMTVALSRANRDNMLLKDALAMMNECAPECNASLNNEKDKEISKLKAELSQMEALLKIIRQNERNSTDTVEQRETANTSTTSEVHPRGRIEKAGSSNGCQDGQARGDAIANGQAYPLSQESNKVRKDEMPASLVAPTISSPRSLPTKDHVEALQQACVKCENYERVLAAIGRSIPGQWSRYEGENGQYLVLTDRLAIRWLLKHLWSQEDNDKVTLKFSSLYEINSRLRKRAQQSCLMLTKVVQNLSASSELAKLSTLHDGMLDDLDRMHSLIRQLEVHLPNDVNFVADALHEQELTRSKVPNGDRLTPPKSPSRYGNSTGGSAANVEKETMRKSEETLKSSSLVDRTQADRAIQTTDIHCRHVGVQCQREFDIKKFFWPESMLMAFPWLRTLTSSCFSFLDTLAVVLDSDFTEDEKQPLILASCNLFREKVLPIFYALAAENLPAGATVKANEIERNVALSEREQVAELRIGSTVSSENIVSSSEETSHQVRCKSPKATVAFDLRSGTQMVFNLYSQIKHALQLLHAIQQSRNAGSLKRRLNSILLSLQLATDFAEDLLFKMNKVRLANENARVSDAKLGWILHNLNRALANVRNDSVLMGSRLRRTDGSVTMLVHENYELRAELNRCKGDLKNKQLKLVDNSKYMHRQTRGHLLVTDQIENGYHRSPHRAAKVEHYKQ